MNHRKVIAVLSVALFVAACGDDADKPGIGGNVQTNTQTNAQTNNQSNSGTNATTGNTNTGANANTGTTANNVNNEVGCSAPAAAGSLDLTASTAPRGYEGLEGVTFYEGIAYGEEDEQLFDIFVQDSANPAPLVVFIHGGGFTGGSRKAILGSTSEVTALLEEGFAFATLDYRLLEAPGTEMEGVIKSLTDSRRGLQFLRRHANDFNIDPELVGLAGGSAGAGTSLWIGLGDEACDPIAQDPILQMSTRIQAIAAVETQATYDLKRWDTDVYGDDYPVVTLQNATNLNPGLYQTIAQFYGLPGDWMNLTELEEEPLLSYRAEVDMLAMADASDPPIYLQNLGSTAMPTGLGSLLHHPLHAEAVYEAAMAGGIDGVQINTPNMMESTSGSWPQFMLDTLAP